MRSLVDFSKIYYFAINCKEICTKKKKRFMGYNAKVKVLETHDYQCVVYYTIKACVNNQ